MTVSTALSNILQLLIKNMRMVYHINFYMYTVQDISLIVEIYIYICACVRACVNSVHCINKVV